jgi:methylenetetrahydrofolate dehydrogenase (NADP+)/methenyltetrahydrofolate cyclohydrolase
MISKATARAKLLDGTELATRIKHQVGDQVKDLIDRKSIVPCLAAVRVGDDPASAVYVRNKIRACEELGIRSEHHALPLSTGESELLSLITELNARADVDGILVQLPLPEHINEAAIIEAVEPAKDVDGFHPMNVGKLAMGRPVFVPCTPGGIIELLEHNQIPIRGASACVVGRSQIVGRPMAQLLLQRDATVTVCHSRTRDLPAVTRQAEILIVAIGRPGFIRGEHVKSAATVIDVGMNKVTEEKDVTALFGADADKRLEIMRNRGYTLVGDVNPSEVDEVAGYRTPVPGGVGLLTIAMLMRNTLKAATLRR